MNLSTATKTFSSTLIAVATAALLAAPTASAGNLKLGAVKASGPTMNCSVPNQIKCTISSAKGIRLVRIQSNTGQGTINVVNKNYAGCPKSVSVAWDSAFPVHNKQIVECSPARLKLKSS
jgi:hypothetical protein